LPDRELVGGEDNLNAKLRTVQFQYGYSAKQVTSPIILKIRRTIVTSIASSQAIFSTKF